MVFGFDPIFGVDQVEVWDLGDRETTGVATISSRAFKINRIEGNFVDQVGLPSCDWRQASFTSQAQSVDGAPQTFLQDTVPDFLTWTMTVPGDSSGYMWISTQSLGEASAVAAVPAKAALPLLLTALGALGFAAGRRRRVV